MSTAPAAEAPTNLAPAKGKKKLIIIIAAAVLVLGGGGGAAWASGPPGPANRDPAMPSV